MACRGCGRKSKEFKDMVEAENKKAIEAQNAQAPKLQEVIVDENFDLLKHIENCRNNRPTVKALKATVEGLKKV